MDDLKRALRDLLEVDEEPEERGLSGEDLRHRLDEVEKGIDDVLWHTRLGDAAEIGKHELVGPPPENTEAQRPQEKGNHVRFETYTFVPREVDRDGSYPLLVFPHGGVHSNFDTRYVTIVRELLDQGYLVVAPEYRGSTGYGKKHYELIDYGGLEIEDTYAARNWMVETSSLVDPDRVGILGWSHGGLHALMNVFAHPDDYAAAFAGVPVSDLVARMGYKNQDYRDLYEADHHIGTSAYEDPDEYRRRSPTWNAEKLETPLLIHTNTADEDVNVLEVESLIRALEAAGKEFEHEVFEDAPGGHAFDRLDTAFAREVRGRVYDFLADHLSPPFPRE